MIGALMIAAKRVAADSPGWGVGSFIPLFVALALLSILVEILKPARRKRNRRRGREPTPGEARLNLLCFTIMIFAAAECWLWTCKGTVGRVLAVMIPLAVVAGIAVLRGARAKRRNINLEIRHVSTKAPSSVPVLKPAPAVTGHVLADDPDVAGRVGAKGEAMVREALKGLPPDRYSILHDVWLPMEDGGETQIDHVVVSPYGIFVIETKNWKGTIYADEHSPVWTKYNYGHKDQFKNPIRQNFKHVASLREKFSRAEQEFVFGVVAMGPEADFRFSVPKGVVYYNELAAWIMGHVTLCIKPEQMPDIISAIQEWASTVSDESRRRHCGKELPEEQA